MQIEDYFEFVDTDAIRIKGHRLGIEHVLRYYRDGYSPEQIADEFPGLSLEKIHATIIYYLRNRAAVDAYLDRTEERAEREYQARTATSSPAVERLRALKELRHKRPA